MTFKDYVNRKNLRSGRTLVTAVIKLILSGNRGILIMPNTLEMAFPRLFILPKVPKQGGHYFPVYKYGK